MCETLHADLKAFLQRQGRLLGEQGSVLHQIVLTQASCSNENVNCDKLEELQNEQKQISNELDEVGKEIVKLLTYYTLCVSDESLLKWNIVQNFHEH